MSLSTVKKNDTIIVLSGRDRGKSGKVVRFYPQKSLVLVEKINLVKKHLKPTRGAPHGGIQEVEQPLLASRVMLVCPHCSKPTRQATILGQNEKRLRRCIKCQEVIA